MYNSNDTSYVDVELDRLDWKLLVGGGLCDYRVSSLALAKSLTI